MGVVECAQVLDADPRHVIRPAQHRVAIGVSHVAGQLVRLVEPRLGRLQFPARSSPMTLPLGLDLAGVEPRQRHPVGLDRRAPAPSGRTGNMNQ